MCRRRQEFKSHSHDGIVFRSSISQRAFWRECEPNTSNVTERCSSRSQKRSNADPVPVKAAGLGAGVTEAEAKIDAEQYPGGVIVVGPMAR